jgi:ATP-dependent 26S proteasome regulatory subunit
MDAAFLRRLQFAVEFPLPTASQRRCIWRQVWPPAAQLDDDVDLDFVARELEFSGGHIRNIALMAAYLACEKRAPISMAHIMAATRREFQKLGRHGSLDRFGPYASLVASEPSC